MILEPEVTLFDLVLCVSDAMDLVSPELVNHHKQVAYISSALAETSGQSEDMQAQLVLAGAVHDIGALSLHERLDLMQFEFRHTRKHSDIGARLLSLYGPLKPLSSIVRRHHSSWHRRSRIPHQCHILHLADRVAVLIRRDRPILNQVKQIRRSIEEQAGKLFMPELVDSFRVLSQQESFWLDCVSSSLYRRIRRKAMRNSIILGTDTLLSLALFFSRIIDFRSHFTAAHSSGVAATAEALAECAGFSPRQCRMMRIAGYLHDIGKLAVPREILEKPGKLTPEEFEVMRCHTFHTFTILETLPGLQTINEYGAFHHERLNGRGYPFHHNAENLSLGARIMAVADVFTAITENRPYRQGMKREDALSVLETMARSGALDGKVVKLLSGNSRHISAVRGKSQAQARKTYAHILRE